MEKNPVYELPDQFRTTEVAGGRNNTATGDARPEQNPGKKISGRTCALAFAALVVMALTLVIVIAIVMFRPTITEFQTETSPSSDQVELIEQEMQNLRELATKHASNISSLKELYGNAIQEMQQLSGSVQQIQNQLNKVNQDIQNQLQNSNQTIQQKLVQLTVTAQHIDAKIDNTTLMHNQRYLDCKQTVVSLNEQTQRNVSQQIELQATKCSEGINALQLQANNSNRAIRTVQMDIGNLEFNVTETSTNVKTLQYKIKELNTTDIVQSKLIRSTYLYWITFSQQGH